MSARRSGMRLRGPLAASLASVLTSMSRTTTLSALDKTISTFPNIHWQSHRHGHVSLHQRHVPIERLHGPHLHQPVLAHPRRKLRIGNETNPIVSCRVEIIVTEVDVFNSTDVSRKTLQPWGSRAFVLQYGELQMFGRPTVSMRRLSQPVVRGSNTLVLDGPVNWLVGDKLGIARTNRDVMWEATWPDDSTEVVEIAAISSDNRTLMLKSNVRFAHEGRSPQVFGNRTFQVGAEVVLLSRSIIIRGPSTDPAAVPRFLHGWQLSLGGSANYQGCIGKSTCRPQDGQCATLCGLHVAHWPERSAPRRAIEVDGWCRPPARTRPFEI